MKSDKNTARLAGIVLILFILSLVPVVALMFYAHPFADEYTEPLNAYRALQNGQGIFSVLKGAWRRMIYNYFNWQGTYSAKFVMAMNPSVFGERYYGYGILAVFLAALAEHFYFLFVLLRKVLRFSGSEWLITASLTFFIPVHFMPDPTQGLYWFESSSYYLGFYGVGLLAMAFCIQTLRSEGKRKKTVYLILSCICAFLTAGGSMQSGMMFLFSFLAIVLVSFTLHKKNAAYTMMPFAIFTAGFLLNVLAPGNAVRGKGSFAGISPFMAIYKSVHEACVLLDEWRNLFLITVMLGVVLPVCLRAVKRVNFRFPMPLLVTLYLCGVFAAQLTPTYYAYDMIGPLRAVNPIYFSFVLLFMLCIYYWAGWLLCRITERGIIRELDTEQIWQWYFSKGILSVLLVFVIGCVASDRMSYITGVSAMTSLLSKEAQAYDEERYEREKLYLANEGSDKVVEVKELENKPYLLFFEEGEPKTDSSNWINRGISTYYGFEKLVLIKKDE